MLLVLISLVTTTHYCCYTTDYTVDYLDLNSQCIHIEYLLVSSSLDYFAIILPYCHYVSIVSTNSVIGLLLDVYLIHFARDNQMNTN